MECIESKNIGPHIDGELAAEAAASLVVHLESCNACRAVRDSFTQLSSEIGHLPALTPPVRLERDLLADFDRVHARKPFLGRILGMRLALPIPAFALILLLFAAGGWAAYQVGRSSVVLAPMVVQNVPSSALTMPAKDAPSLPDTVQPIAETRTITRVVNVCSQPARTDRAVLRTSAQKQNGPVLASTSTPGGLLTDLKLDGFRPPETMNAKIIKGAKNDEK